MSYTEIWVPLVLPVKSSKSGMRKCLALLTHSSFILVIPEPGHLTSWAASESKGHRPTPSVEILALTRDLAGTGVPKET
jgi:hypothetical protein